MRKIFALLLALVICLSLAACGETENPDNGGNTGNITNDDNTKETETEGLVLTDGEEGYTFINQARFHELVEVVELTLDNWKDFIAICSYTEEEVERDAFDEIVSTQTSTTREFGAKGEKFYYMHSIAIELKDKSNGELTVYEMGGPVAVEVGEDFDLEQYECTRIKGQVCLLDVPEEAIWLDEDGGRHFTVRYSDISIGPPMGADIAGKDGRRVGGLIDILLDSWLS